MENNRNLPHSTHISSFEFWRGDVVNQIEEIGAMDNSDADGITMMNKSKLEELHQQGVTPEVVARQLLGLPTELNPEQHH
ncbi:hypothetical protein [Iodobacter fluviatilis]|uniref:Uncharacterized protein n=1 Tax=Iodobacter fluviatilis TaxID=537 RepID=A0A377Q5C3_9NEIS|nr:hypothetical protein [Iodobacter fluviatilis]TCU84546.1 hypothetical protein EV682_10971 [Iodobacter fluviatilis]STQ90012.1 Uncharacterised protein [Iodobacter fluviatilis]